MAKLTNRLTGRTAALIVAVGAALGSGAALSLASGPPQIKVCVKHHGGTLYKKARCKRGDASLTWNLQGPQGLPGQNGTNGTGPAYGVYDTGGINASDNSYHTVITLRIPSAGTYVLTGKVEAYNTGGTAVTPSCQLVAGSDYDQSDGAISGSGPGADTTLPLEVAHTYGTGPATAVLQCNPRSIATHFGFSKIIAMQMSNVAWGPSS